MRAAYPQLPRQDPIIQAAQPRFGDYQMNNAMGLFKEYGKQVKNRGERPLAYAQSCIFFKQTNWRLWVI